MIPAMRTPPALNWLWFQSMMTITRDSAFFNQGRFFISPFSFALFPD
jgi:hypothetical protein